MASDFEATSELQFNGTFVAWAPQIDLSTVRLRVSKEHPDFTHDQLNKIEGQYLEFLMICKAEPGIRHEPDKYVDLFWHAHILHTSKYMEDCNKYFGYFLHHEPKADGQGCDDGCAVLPAQ